MKVIVPFSYYDRNTVAVSPFLLALRHPYLRCGAQLRTHPASKRSQ